MDYTKTGIAATLDRSLQPMKHPHFMQRGDGRSTYKSEKILGQLYDRVEHVDFEPAFENSFDHRILWAFDLTQQILDEARDLKREYDEAVRRIMAQYDILSEFEVWSTFVLHHSAEMKDFKFHETIGDASVALKDRYRNAVIAKVGSKEFQILAPFVTAMYRVTSQEMEEAKSRCRSHQMRMTTSNMPFISFPWLFQSILGKIANGKGASRVEGTDAFANVRTEPMNFAQKTPSQNTDILCEFNDVGGVQGTNHHSKELAAYWDALQDQGLRDVDVGSGDSTGDDKPKPATGILIDIGEIETTEGVRHRGEELALFEDKKKDDSVEEKSGMAVGMKNGVKRQSRDRKDGENDGFHGGYGLTAATKTNVNGTMEGEDIVTEQEEEVEEDEGLEEEVSIELDDGPSLLDRLAKLNKQ